ncbi:related to Smad nuclear interacting protein 1 [Melanopsichium pennsylvanicum]|uniref:Related to Smad nuclear interacting protein 1 n=2 Tax=Melanopsichium pennsylvanicum TaxID=63383 RepID=A0AAJ4XGT4_9BASI|nr:smad fha domain-containing protein [Melanopsichium pennsylvanicum 4]SNX82205.1 related to Smad nuclear interacting protein 1 [Melanopsichium pennsylvanicum]
MPETAAEVSTSKVGAQQEYQEISSFHRPSGYERGNKHVNQLMDERRGPTSHSHRVVRDEDRHKDKSCRREDRHVRSSGLHREDLDDKLRSKYSSSRRWDDGEDRDRLHRRQRDEGLYRSRKASSRHRDDHDHSVKHQSSGIHRHRGERSSRERSSLETKEPLRRRSRSRSPLPQASSSRRSPPPSQPQAHFLDPVEGEEEIDQDAPNFAPSGLLAAESNSVNGVALKYHEPPEARKPKSPWRMYCFKDGKDQEVLHLGAQSCYLLGRDRTVADIPLDHESCSKQHAVIQFRQMITTNEFGDKKKRIGPFLLDLESSNGSYVNHTEIPTSRYYQLRSGDALTFGASTRDYVLLDETSA